MRYRVTGGASRNQRQLTLGRHGPLTPDEARERARQALAAASAGTDPLADRSSAQDALTMRELVERFLAKHADKKRKPRTAAFYRWTLRVLCGRPLQARGLKSASASWSDAVICAAC